MTDQVTAHLDYEKYRRLLIEAAVELADGDRQSALWGRHLYDPQPEELSTPIEMSAAFVDDAYAREFLSQHKNQLTIEQIESAERLIHALIDLPESALDGPPSQVIDSDEWKNVRHLANDFVRLWRHS